MNKLYLGVAREIITPSVGSRLYGYSPDIVSTSVEDDLTVTALYFEYGEKKAFLFSITVCEMKTELCDEIRLLLQLCMDVPAENCMLCATHTHSGPNVAGSEGWGDIDEEYCREIFIPQILSAADKAKRNLTEVKMGIAFGNSFVGVNRRQLMLDNTVDFGQNPWGCFNPEMTVISFVDTDNNPVANIVHYGCHGTSAGANTEITRDWAGLMTDALDKESGALTAFVNGTMGDVGPRISNGRTTGNITYVKELGEIAARDVLEIYKKISSYESVGMKTGEYVLPIPLKKRMENADAEKMYEKYKGETINLAGMIKAYLETVMELNNNGVPEAEVFEIKQSVLAVGDVVLSGIPYEMFSETGFRLNDAFKDKKILSVSNTNGFEGYFVTEDAMCRGGYEVEMFRYGRPQPFCENADWFLLKNMIDGIVKITEA